MMYEPGPVSPIDVDAFRRAVRPEPDTTISDGFGAIAQAAADHARLLDGAAGDFYDAAQLNDDPGDENELFDLLDDVATFEQTQDTDLLNRLGSEIAGAESIISKMEGAFALEHSPDEYPRPAPFIPAPNPFE